MPQWQVTGWAPLGSPSNLGASRLGHSGKPWEEWQVTLTSIAPLPRCGRVFLVGFPLPASAPSFLSRLLSSSGHTEGLACWRWKEKIFFSTYIFFNCNFLLLIKIAPLKQLKQSFSPGLPEFGNLPLSGVNLIIRQPDRHLRTQWKALLF